jgi:hypothetical protein
MSFVNILTGDTTPSPPSRRKLKCRAQVVLRREGGR